MFIGTGVVGNLRYPNLLYRNDGGTLTARAVYSTTEMDWTKSVAWGDYDGDGDLDLVVGNGGGSPNRLYRNDGGTLTPWAVWTSVEGDDTRSVAWGDYDGDGDLDLAVGNVNQPNRVYRNDSLGAVVTMTMVYSTTETHKTHSVAWVDTDGDGDLDLLAGDACTGAFPDCRSIRLYRNDGGTLTSSAVWSSDLADETRSVACADVDGPNGSVRVRIVDLCPECASGDLDLSPQAFDQIAERAQGRVPITWTFVACDVAGPVAYRFKDGSHQWWTAIQVWNHRLPIASLEWSADGGATWNPTQRVDYNYFIDESGFGPDATRVRITAIDGQVLEDDLPPVQEYLVVQGQGQFN